MFCIRAIIVILQMMLSFGLRFFFSNFKPTGATFFILEMNFCMVGYGWLVLHNCFGLLN